MMKPLTRGQNASDITAVASYVRDGEGIGHCLPGVAFVSGSWTDFLWICSPTIFLQLHNLWKTAQIPLCASQASSTLGTQPANKPNKKRRLPILAGLVRSICPPSP